MNILLIGQGGREHALAKSISQSPEVDVIYVYPGNDGIATENKVKLINFKEEGDIYHLLLNFAIKEKIDLTIVGPEDYLEGGIVDLFEKNGSCIFGPTKKAAQLETSKFFAKKIMDDCNIPTAKYFVSDIKSELINFIKNFDEKNGLVLKADQLAAGKGVIVCTHKDQALLYIEKFHEKYNKVIIEEKLEGHELSFFAFIQGCQYRFLGMAQDYKRLRNHDEGPNTGGMGAISPVPFITKKDKTLIKDRIIIPLIKKLKEDSNPFNGLLFIGIMMTLSGPKVLEFNVRFGDPETQTLVPLLNEDLVPWLQAVAKKDLSSMPERDIKLRPLHASHIVMASKNYPYGSSPACIIENRNQSDIHEKNTRNDFIFYSGVKKIDNQLYTNGGRILGITTVRDTLKECTESGYKILNNINFDGGQFRTDIGKNYND